MIEMLANKTKCLNLLIIHMNKSKKKNDTKRKTYSVNLPSGFLFEEFLNCKY